MLSYVGREKSFMTSRPVLVLLMRLQTHCQIEYVHLEKAGLVSYDVIAMFSYNTYTRNKFGEYWPYSR